VSHAELEAALLEAAGIETRAPDTGC